METWEKVIILDNIHNLPFYFTSGIYSVQFRGPDPVIPFIFNAIRGKSQKKYQIKRQNVFDFNWGNLSDVIFAVTQLIVFKRKKIAMTAAVML
jgi:hypothetical protein